MIHYLLLKFKPGSFSPEVYQFSLDTYRQLQDVVKGIEKISVMQNETFRHSNADLLIRIVFSGEVWLDEYLKHPLHLKFVEQVDRFVEQRLAFDQM